MIVLCLEILAPGKRFAESTRIRIEEDRLKGFAAEFNAQPFHLNTDAAGRREWGRASEQTIMRR